MSGVFNPLIFSPLIFNTGASVLTGTIPEGSTAELAVPARPSAAVTVPERSGALTTPDRPTATVED